MNFFIGNSSIHIFKEKLSDIRIPMIITLPSLNLENFLLTKKTELLSSNNYDK